MRVIHGLESSKFSGVVLTVGNFDGVHRGHQAILAAGRRRADEMGAELVAMTFDPHPLAVLTPEHVPAILTPLDQKLRLLEETGVDTVVMVRSRPEFLSISADVFISDMIVSRFRPGLVVEGASFAFGHHRQGDVEMLRGASQQLGFELQVVEPVRVALGGHPDAVISSSLIRQLLRSGAVDQAALCLGRPYRLVGRVTRGAGRGKGLGFPTANLFVEKQLVPAEGVYAACCELDGRSWAVAASIGRCETFDGDEVVIEAYLLSYQGDLYDRAIPLDFLDWIRPQERFESAGLLCEAMSDDVERVREICTRHGCDA
jgi:riboflavin kinase/FMN adenylyltransferase